MDHAKKAQWLAALRSGEYQQTRGTLKVTRTDGTSGYCCQGVLAELDGVLSSDGQGWLVDLKDGSMFDGSRSYYFPVPDMELVGELSTMNDDRVPFPAIADWIEANL